MTGSLSTQDALIAVMLITSAVGSEMHDSELAEIRSTVDLLPAFVDYDKDRIGFVSESVIDLLDEDDGLDTLLGMIKDATPDRLHETVYALACDIAAADGRVEMAEMRWLEMLRQGLQIDRLNAAAIERGSRARHTRV